MKYIAITLFVIFSCQLQTSADQLTIIKEDWNKAKQIAKDQNKLILIDFYATWCGPCKAFSAKLAENKDLQNQLSKDFVMLKYNAEKDKKFNLTKKFHINAYPTFVAISPNVQYVDRMIGGDLSSNVGEERFLQFAQNAKETFRTKTYPLGYNYKLDNTYPTFYKNSMNKEGKMNQEDLEAYWRNTKDYSSEVSFAIYSMYGGPTIVDDYFLKHRDIFEEKFGKSATGAILEKMSSLKFQEAFKMKDRKRFDDAKVFSMANLDTFFSIQSLPVIEARFAAAQNECYELEKIVKGLVRTENNLTAEQINEICWEVYKSDCKKTSLLGSAENLISNVLEGNKNYQFLDTYACILYKSGRYKDAALAMESAIEYATKANIDYQESSKVLKLINERINGD